MSDFGDFGGCHECGEHGTHGSDCSWGHEENNIRGGFGGSGPSLFKIVFWVIVVMLVMAMFSGISVTAPVLGFLLEVLLMAGFITILLR